MFLQKAFLQGEYVNLAWSIILLLSGGNISLPARYSYLTISTDDKADIFAASILIKYWNFVFLIVCHVYFLYSF